MSTTEFAMNLTVDGTTATIQLTGEIDIASSGQLADLGAATVRTDGVQTLVLDMSEVTFLDSTGLGALIHIREAAQGHSIRLGMLRPTPPVRKLLDLTGMNHLFEIASPAADPG